MLMIHVDELKTGQRISMPAWWEPGDCNVTAEVIAVEPYNGYGRTRKPDPNKRTIQTTIGPFVVDSFRQVTIVE